MRTSVAIPLWIFICFAVGFVASHFQTEALTYWYPLLDKSAYTPPNIVFPIVWSILYLLMGISAGLVTASAREGRNVVLLVFTLQLLLNFLWSITFFTMRNSLLGLLNIVLLDVAVIYYIVRSYRVSRVAALLFVPYVVWLAMATYLNAYITIYNN